MLYIQKLPKSEVPETHGSHSPETRGIHLELTHGAHLLRHVHSFQAHTSLSESVIPGYFHPEQAQFSKAQSPEVPKYLNDKNGLIQV